MKKLALVGMLILAAALLAQPVAAQEPGPTPSPDEVNAIAKNLYCPVCSNVPLDACGTAACVQWREEIADLLTEGYSAQQIYDHFEQQFGPSVLAEPPRTGFFWLIYVLPPLAVVAGGWMLWRAYSQARKEAPAATPSKAAKSDYARRLEEALEERDK